MKKMIFVTLAYLLISMALGMSWHFVFFKDIYDGLGIYNRAEPIIPLGFTSMFIQGFIISYLFSKMQNGGSSLREGLRFSALMGLFLFSVSTLANGAKIHVNSMSTWLAVQTGFHVIQFALLGLAIGFIYSKKSD